MLFAETQDHCKQLCMAQRIAMLILQALKYQRTFEYVVLQQLAVLLANRFTNSFASFPSNSTSVVELMNRVKCLC
eukprot:scaffold30076_cov76-Attheya_sp.AAC.4